MEWCLFMRRDIFLPPPIDLVVDQPHWKANLFMNDAELNSNQDKLFNVAITRAKFKLLIDNYFTKINEVNNR